MHTGTTNSKVCRSFRQTLSNARPRCSFASLVSADQGVSLPVFGREDTSLRRAGMLLKWSWKFSVKGYNNFLSKLQYTSDSQSRLLHNTLFYDVRMSFPTFQDRLAPSMSHASPAGGGAAASLYWSGCGGGTHCKKPEEGLSVAALSMGKVLWT